MSPAKVFASFAVSLDGYIASPSGDMGWLNNAMSPAEDYGFAATMQRTGAYLLGANTYREMQSMTGGGDATPTYVVTHQSDWPAAGKPVRFVSGALPRLLDEIKRQTAQDIWVFGGGQLVSQCLALDLLDEINLALVPVVLGGGVPLWAGLTAPKTLRLADCRAFPSGIVMLRYERAAATKPKRRRKA